MQQVFRLFFFVQLACLAEGFSVFPSQLRSNVAYYVHSKNVSALFASLPSEVDVELPDGITARVKIEPVLSVPSEIVEVRYKIPFDLSVEPKDNLAVCTKEGKGGEKVGDILRFNTQWTLGLPRGDGAITTVASFAGGVSWQCSLFDVTRAKSWELVVESLVSNQPSRTNEVVLLFERPIEGGAPSDN